MYNPIFVFKNTFNRATFLIKLRYEVHILVEWFGIVCT